MVEAIKRAIYVLEIEAQIDPIMVNIKDRLQISHAQTNEF
jgi:hypothetical protein